MKIDELIKNPLKNAKKHAHAIHDIQAQWQLLDLSSKPASKSQWLNFNELTNKAWEPCKEYFDEIKEIKINNAKELKNKVKYRNFGKLNVALKNIFKIIKTEKLKKNVILFSPCAASFDSFRNFEDRGFYFNKLIKKYLNGKQKINI